MAFGLRGFSEAAFSSLPDVTPEPTPASGWMTAADRPVKAATLFAAAIAANLLYVPQPFAVVAPVTPAFDWYVQPAQPKSPPPTRRDAVFIPMNQEQHFPLGWLPSTIPVRYSTLSRSGPVLREDQEQHRPLGWLASTVPVRWTTQRREAVTVLAHYPEFFALGWLPSTTPVRYAVTPRSGTYVHQNQEQHYPLGWLPPTPPVKPQQNALQAKVAVSLPQPIDNVFGPVPPFDWYVHPPCRQIKLFLAPPQVFIPYDNGFYPLGWLPPVTKPVQYRGGLSPAWSPVHPEPYNDTIGDASSVCQSGTFKGAKLAGYGVSASIKTTASSVALGGGGLSAVSTLIAAKTIKTGGGSNSQC